MPSNIDKSSVIQSMISKDHGQTFNDETFAFNVAFFPWNAPTGLRTNVDKNSVSISMIPKS